MRSNRSSGHNDLVQVHLKEVLQISSECIVHQDNEVSRVIGSADWNDHNLVKIHTGSEGLSAALNSSLTEPDSFLNGDRA